MSLFGGCSNNGSDSWIWIIVIVVLILCCCNNDNGCGILGSQNNCC